MRTKLFCGRDGLGKNVERMHKKINRVVAGTGMLAALIGSYGYSSWAPAVHKAMAGGWYKVPPVVSPVLQACSDVDGSTV